MYFIPEGKLEFQSTLPVKGATIDCTKIARNLNISIHAPREGSDSNVD